MSMKAENETWQCTKNCGACCFLDPLQREDALKALSEEDALTYLKMVGLDGWCIHLDKATKKCKIYSSRPEFCKIHSLIKLFHIKRQNLNRYAINCCREHISSIYGNESTVMRDFNHNIRNENGGDEKLCGKKTAR